MPELRYTPKRKNRIPEWILTGCAVILVACVLFRMFKLGHAIIWECLFLVAAVVAIWVSTRFLTSSYTYTLDYENKLFLVSQKQGRRITCLCRLDLSDLYLVRPYEERDKDADRMTRYVYCVTFHPAESYLLFFRNEGRNISIRVECEGEFLAALEQVAAAYHPTDEDSEPADVEDDESAEQ